MTMRRKPGAGGLAALACALLAGCGGNDFSFFGPVPGQSAGEAVSNLVAYGAFDNPNGPHGDKKDDRNGALICPDVSIRDGTNAVRIYAGAESGSNVRYEYALGDVARKCARAGGDITLKVGVEGRVLLGPVGAPGTFNVPVRIVVLRQSTSEAAFTKLYSVPVTIQTGATSAPFRFVAENLAVPFVSNRANQDYDVQVGFDSAGAKSDRPAGKRRKGG